MTFAQLPVTVCGRPAPRRALVAASAVIAATATRAAATIQPVAAPGVIGKTKRPTGSHQTSASRGRRERRRRGGARSSASRRSGSQRGRVRSRRSAQHVRSLGGLRQPSPRRSRGRPRGRSSGRRSRECRASGPRLRSCSSGMPRPRRARTAGADRLRTPRNRSPPRGRRGRRASR